MDPLVYITKGVLGLILGLYLGRTDMFLAAGALAGLIGDTAVITYSVSCLMAAIPKDLSIVENKHELTIGHVYDLAFGRAWTIIGSMFLAWMLTQMGWKVSIGATIITLFVVLIWRYQISLTFWLTGLAVFAALKGGEVIGMTNSALAGIVAIRTLIAKQRWLLQTKRQVDFQPNMMEVIFGIFIGAVPTLNARLFTDDEVTIWNLDAVGEGFIMGLIVFQRDSSRTTFGTLVGQYAKDLSPEVIMITIAVTLWVCVIPAVVRHFYTQVVELSFSAEILLFSGGFAWYGGIVEQPLIGLTAGAIIYMLIQEPVGVNSIAYKFSHGVLCVPMLLLSLGF